MNPVTWTRPTHPKPFRYEDAAWRELAQQFAEPIPCIASDVEPTRRGLCYAITYLHWAQKIDATMKRRMFQRLDTFVQSGEYAYESSYTYNEDFTPNRSARVMACLWLALDSQIDP